MRKKIIQNVFLMCFILANPGLIMSQNLYMESSSIDQGTFIGLKYLRPMIKDGDIKGATGIYQLEASMSLNAKVNLVTYLPFAVAKFDNSYYDESMKESGIGNLYVGLQLPLKKRNSSLSFGVNLPTASDEKWESMMIGLLSDPYHIRSYIPKTVTLYMNMAYQLLNDSPALFAVEIGPDILISTEEGGDPEALIHYALNGGYKLKSLALMAGLSGLMILSEKDVSFQDRTSNMLTFGAQYSLRIASLGLFYSWSLDEYAEGSVLGLRCLVKIK